MAGIVTRKGQVCSYRLVGIVLWEVVIAKIVMGANPAIGLYLYLRAGLSLLTNGIPAQRYFPQPSVGDPLRRTGYRGSHS